ncbi:MAG: ECF RNA polymerase sigma-E factor [Chroococcopsis gigantea SAG 12.99]|jgi:RNA polymerase sigma-70 factor (ECF subfamily)|nr:ECF RNA polymerase sigma-E factor [Chroococcopsis gigantea SAG 12.99]
MVTVLADSQARMSDAEGTLRARELVIQCQRGSRSAFGQLYRRYQQRVRSTLYQLCGQEMLDDLVQEVFLKVWRGLPQLRQPEHFSTWLYRITWNVATDGRRQFAKRQREQVNGKDEENSLGQISSKPQDTPDLMQIHYQDLVRRGLETLSIDHRAVLVLHDLEDLPQKEIGQILQIPVGTVKSRLHHARNAIRQFLEKQGVL